MMLRCLFLCLCWYVCMSSAGEQPKEPQVTVTAHRPSKLDCCWRACTGCTDQVTRITNASDEFIWAIFKAKKGSYKFLMPPTADLTHTRSLITLQHKKTLTIHEKPPHCDNITLNDKPHSLGSHYTINPPQKTESAPKQPQPGCLSGIFNCLLGRS